MRQKICTVMCLCLLTGAVSGCGTGAGRSAEDNKVVINMEQIIVELPDSAFGTDDPIPAIPESNEENPALKYREMPDIEVNYDPELWHHRSIPISASPSSTIISWKDILIIRHTIYRREDGIYKRTRERLQDWLPVGGDEHLDRYYYYQWENLLMVHDNKPGSISIYDMDSMQLRSYPYNSIGPACVYQGKIYYEDWEEDAIYCMDPFSGDIEVIYDDEEVWDFAIRDNGDMMISVKTQTDPTAWEVRLLSHDAQGNLNEKKIWESDQYEFLHLLDFNDHGLFLRGETHNDIDLFCLKDNGEREEMMVEEGWEREVVNILIVDEGYFMWDSQMVSGKEKLEILGWHRMTEAENVVDSISYYDFQGNKLKTWQLIDDEMLKAGYHLEYIAYDSGEITAFYANEKLDDLYISKVQTL